MGFSVINHPAIGLPGYPQKGRSHLCDAALQRLGARTSPSKVRDGKRLFCWFLGHGDMARVVWWCLLHRSSVSTIGDTRINKLRAVEIRIPNASWLPLILVTGALVPVFSCIFWNQNCGDEPEPGISMLFFNPQRIQKVLYCIKCD